MCREIVAYIFIGMLLSVIFIGTYMVAYKSTEVANVFPPRDCPGIRETYGVYLEEFAIKEQAYIASMNY